VTNSLRKQFNACWREHAAKPFVLCYGYMYYICTMFIINKYRIEQNKKIF